MRDSSTIKKSSWQLEVPSKQYSYRYVHLLNQFFQAGSVSESVKITWSAKHFISPHSLLCLLQKAAPQQRCTHAHTHAHIHIHWPSMLEKECA
mmetsp:Transcript_16599/g.45591  ORF Transcript_16599/g.45591 Transcript_16599/m.45591 type:complete len:93 (-) Transcript_16599:2321-2599(-)